jgi:shikimate dehydrogenase
MIINGLTEVIAHLGYPTHSFKAPMIYNPYFEQQGLNIVVVPMACTTEHFAQVLPAVFKLQNTRGALITMPHKVSVVGMLDQVSRAVEVAGACNAVRRDEAGRLIGDMFDGEGFVRGILNKGLILRGSSALVIGAGGVGSAISASLAGAGVSRLSLFDVNASASEELASRIRIHYPGIAVQTGSNDPVGHQLVVNATPLGMNPNDPLPVDVDRLSSETFVGEVVMKTEMTSFLQAAANRGCPVQIGADMLFEQIPAYLEFFGLPTTTASNLRSVATLHYT